MNLTWPWTAFLYGLTNPHVQVDGHLVARGWGTHTVGLPAGAAQVAIHVPYLGFRVGKARFTSEPGGPEHLEYRPPYLTTLRGDLGVTARSKGAAAVGALILAVLLLPAAWVLYLALQVDHELTAAFAAPSAPAAASSTPGGTATPGSVASDILTDGHGMVLEVQTPGADPFTGDLGPAAALLERRLTLAGITGATVDPGSSGFIVAHLPATPDQATIDLLGKPVDLAFRPVLAIAGPAPSVAGGSGLVVSDRPTSPSDTSYYVTDALTNAFQVLDCTAGARRLAPVLTPDAGIAVCGADGQSKYILGPVEIEGRNVATATATSSQVITMTFDSTGTNEFRTTTDRLQALAGQPPLNQIAMVLDGEVISAPAVASGVIITDGKVQISGSLESAGDLAAQITLGSHAADFTVQSVR